MRADRVASVKNVRLQQKSCRKVWQSATNVLPLQRPKGQKLFYIMKTNQFVKRLKAAGCRLVRHGAEHDIWYSPVTGRSDRVPRHGSKEVGKGLLKSLERTLLGL